MSQEEMFLKSEADAWYTRNAHMLVPAKRHEDVPVMLLRRQKLSFKRVLEIGASNGWRLEVLRTYTPHASYLGIEPSSVAVRGGKKAFPKVSLKRGVISDLPSKNAFDLVLVIFVLHWAPREKLLASIAEIDRMVAEGGHLLISDFLPRTPRKNAYRHTDKIFTWKMDYGALFEATGNYSKVERMIYHYETNKPATSRTPDDMRAVATLYRKKTGGGYKKYI